MYLKSGSPGSHTRISSNIDGVVGVTRVGACVGALCLTLLLIDHQLHPVPKLLRSDGVPLSIAEALALRHVLRCDSSSSVVNVEKKLGVREGTWKK